MPDVQRTNNLSISNLPEKEEWKPPTEALSSSDWKPPTDAIKSTPQIPEEPSALSRAWAYLNEPLIKATPEMQQALEKFSEDHPIMGGAGNLALGAVTGMSSPMALGLGALTGGAGLAEKLGSEGLATALHTPGRLAAGGMVGHGLYNVFSQPDLGGKIGGGLEAGMGVLGLRGPKAITPEIVPPEISSKPIIPPNRKLLNPSSVIHYGEATLHNVPPGPEFQPTDAVTAEEPKFKGSNGKAAEQMRYDIVRDKLKMGLDVPELPKGIKVEGKPFVPEGTGKKYKIQAKDIRKKFKAAISEEAKASHPILKSIDEAIAGNDVATAKKLRLNLEAMSNQEFKSRGLADGYTKLNNFIDRSGKTAPKKLPDITEGFGGSGHPESPEYVGKVLKAAGKGKPGLAIEPAVGSVPSIEAKQIVYRGPDGNAVAVAKVVQDQNGKNLVMDLATDKSKGLLSGRAMKAIGGELVKLKAENPAGTITDDALNFKARMKARLGEFAKSEQGSARLPEFGRKKEGQITGQIIRDKEYQKLWNNPDENSFEQALDRQLSKINQELDPEVIRDNYNNWQQEYEWQKIHGTPDDLETAGTIRDEALDKLRQLDKRKKTSIFGNQEGVIRRPDPYSRETRPEVVNKFIDALKAAGPKRAEQESLYSEERSVRIRAAGQVKGSGLKKFYGQLHELKGELPKVDFERTKLSPSDLNDLLNTVDKSSYLLPFEKIRAKMGLLKMLTAKRAEVPTTSELKLLGEVFGKDFDEIVEMHGGIGGPIAKQIVQDVANMPKAIMASVDMSAPLRQGLPLIHKKEWWASIKPMVEAFANEKNYEATMQAIKDRPKYLLGKEAGLKLTGIESDLGTREEAYGSNLANLVPGVKRSERAYVAFLNKLRADTFDSLIEDAKRMGMHPKDSMHEIANFVNVATGRGSLGNFDKVATELNTAFFSPRLIASRLTMLNPNYYVQASPFVRKEALKSLLAVASAGLTTNALLSAMGGKTDTKLSDSKGSPLLPIQGLHGFPGMPINADFGKTRFGNTRIENYGGFLPYITYAGRMLSGERESSTTGKVTQLGKGFNTASRLSTTEDFVANKLSPVAGLIYKILKQKDPTGKEYQLTPTMKQSLIDISNGNIDAAIRNAKGGELGDMFIPMFLGDLIDIYKDDPKHLPLAAGSFFGTGTQTYPPTQRKSTSLRIRP